MSQGVEIIKHGGKRPTEPFKREKLFDSILAICLSVQTPVGQAEATANSVCDDVIAWLKGRSEVTSRDIQTVAGRSLKKYHPEAAYLYERRRITI